MFKIPCKRFSQLVKIKYGDILEKNSKELYDLIGKAYGKEGLGLVVIENVPKFHEKREKLFKNIHTLANLKEDVLKGLEHKEHNYSLGWSKGAESFEDTADVNKGSFYAIVPNFEGKTLLKNVFPKEIPELEQNYYTVAKEIQRIGLMLTKHIDHYIQSVYPSYETEKASKHIMNSTFNMGRMLYYYPGKKLKEGQVEDWCGFHNDHGSLTGLCKNMYFDSKTGNIVTESFKKTGLYIQSRKGELVKAVYGDNDIAYQIGESLQVISGGLLHATPHVVKKYEDVPEGVGRVTLALFMQPNKDQFLNIPSESNFQNIQTSMIYKVPKIQDRIRQGMTFGDFDKVTVEAYYKNYKM